MTELYGRPHMQQLVREVSLREIIKPLFRRRMLLVAMFLGTLVTVIALGFVIPRPYKAKMAVLVRRERLDPLVTSEAVPVPPSGSTEVTVEEITSESALLLSQDLLEEVVLATGLNKEPSYMKWMPVHYTADEITAHAVKKLAKDLTVKNETNSNLIEVSYSSGDPKLAFSVLHSLGELYVQKHVAIHRTPGSFQFFSKETDRYLRALQDTEASLKKFNGDEGVSSPDVLGAALAQQLATSEGLRYAAQQAIASDQERIGSDQAQMKATPQRSTATQSYSPADKLLDDLGAALISAKTKRTQLEAKYDIKYPLVIEADAEVSQIESAISQTTQTKYLTETTSIDPTYEVVREDLAKTTADLAAQQAGERAVARSIAELQAKMINLSQKSLTQQDLIREAKADEGNYLLYLSKREQERTSDALDQTKIANVAIAVPPAIPVLPLYSTPILVVVALALSIVLSIGITYSVDYLDSSFHTPAEVIEILGIPLVVAIPKKSA